MSDSTIPDRATFVRDRLAEWLEGLGHDVTDVDQRDGFPCLTVETWDGATWDDVAVTTDGRIMSMVDGWREVRLRGFDWTPEPTDTGMVHGPHLTYPANLGHGRHTHSARGCAYCASIIFDGPGL